MKMVHVSHPPSSYTTVFLVYMIYAIAICVGHFTDFLSKIFGKDKIETGYRPLLKDFDDFYIRHLYRRLKDCWQRPICSRPSTWIDVMEVVSSDYNRTQVYVYSYTR